MSVSVGRLIGKSPPRRFSDKDCPFVLPETFLGLELEVENFPNNAVLPQDLLEFWLVKEDGSLRNRGMELVFSQPLNGPATIQALDAFLNWRKGVRITTSVRTGLHVHMDVREMEVPQLVSFLMLYTALEPLIFKWVGAAREESNFCVPFYYSDDALKAAYKIIDSLMGDEYEIAKSGNVKYFGKESADRFERYAGLNLQALARFGSVEFRHMPMLFERQRIVDWINIILGLKKGAIEHTPQELVKWIQHSKYNVHTFITTLGGPLYPQLARFEINGPVHAQVCHAAEEFSRVGATRKWTTRSAKFSGENHSLSKFNLRKQTPADAERRVAEALAQVENLAIPLDERVVPRMAIPPRPGAVNRVEPPLRHGDARQHPLRRNGLQRWHRDLGWVSQETFDAHERRVAAEQRLVEFVQAPGVRLVLEDVGAPAEEAQGWAGAGVGGAQMFIEPEEGDFA